MAAVALGTAWLGGPVFALLWLAAGIAIAFEWNAITGAQPRAVLGALCAAGLAGLVVAFKLDAGWSAEVAVTVLVLGAIALVADSGRNRAWALAGFLYAAIVALVPTMLVDAPSLRTVGVLWMVGVVWTTDVVAYFPARAIGCSKLASRISTK